MNGIIIPPSVPVTLKPLLCGRDIYDLPVMGEAINIHQRRHFAKYGIDDVYIYALHKSTDIQTVTGDFVVACDGNIISDDDLNSLVSLHKKSDADVTAVLRTKPYNSSFVSYVSVDKEDNITDICDTYCNFAPDSYILGGIYVISRSILRYFAAAEPAISGVSVISHALRSSLKVVGVLSDRPYAAVNTTGDYKKCHSDILNGKLPVSLRGTQIKDGFWIESGADIENGVKIEIPVYISRGCHISRGAKIGDSFIGNGCNIKSDATVVNSLLGNGCTISENASVGGAVLSDNISLGTASQIGENAVIGSGCRIEGNSHIADSVKIWPNKRILHGTRLSDNLVWGSAATEHLIRNGRICGEVNIDITPEFMAKLGAALGTVYPGGRIGVGYDSSPVCSMLASSVAAGLTSAGARLFMFGEQTLPMTRDGLNCYRLSAALHINQSAEDGTFYPEITFIEDIGTNFRASAAQRLESVFFNNVFFRADAGRLTEAVDLSGYRLSYVQNILNGLRSVSFRMNVEVRTRSETISEILELILGELEQNTEMSAAREFSAEIKSDGQRITLFSKDGSPVDKNRTLCIICIVLLKHFGVRKIVLPVSAPTELEALVRKSGAEVIRSKTSDNDFSDTVIRHNLHEQLKMCFDGIYCLISLLDYLNSSNITFGELMSSVPEFAQFEAEIECPGSRKGEILKKLRSKYKASKVDTTDGMKIYQNDGWVLILPEKYRHYVRIITDGYDMETAEEICNIFTNQIKRLANLQ